MQPPSRHPANKKRETHQQQDMRHLVAQLPCADFAACLNDAVFGLAEMVEPLLGKKIQSERQSCQPVGQNAVVNVAAGGEVAGQRRWPLPGFAPAACVLVILVCERLAAW